MQKKKTIVTLRKDMKPKMKILQLDATTFNRNKKIMTNKRNHPKR